MEILNVGFNFRKCWLYINWVNVIDKQKKKSESEIFSQTDGLQINKINVQYIYFTLI